jgi:hypothetical protein
VVAVGIGVGVVDSERLCCFSSASPLGLRGGTGLTAGLLRNCPVAATSAVTRADVWRELAFVLFDWLVLRARGAATVGSSREFVRIGGEREAPAMAFGAASENVERKNQ